MSEIVSLFAGAGGFDLGAIAAGHKIIRAYEWDQSACDTYSKIVGNHIEQADLDAIDPATIPDSEGIIAGPPCQDFSIAGNMDRENGARNLFPATLRILEAKRPAWILIENVPGLVSAPYFHQIVLTLKDMGYAVKWRLVNAAYYGVPQTRVRVFIAAFRDRCSWRFPAETHFPNKVGCSSSMFYETTPSWIKYVHLAESHPLPRWLTNRIDLPGRSTMFGTALANYCTNVTMRSGDQPALTVTASSVERKKPILLDGDDAYFSRQLSQRQHPTPIWRDRSQPAFTVLASDGGHANPILANGQELRVTNSMAAALQTLPYDSCLNAKQIGNAVPPLLAQKLLEQF